jgi:STE24 endopeptidase
VARLILLLILAIWLIGAETIRQPEFNYRPALTLFLAGHLGLIVIVWLWARMLSRRLAVEDHYRSVLRFHKLVSVARWVVPAWLAFGIFGPAAWADLILSHTGTRLQLPGVLLGTLPSMLTWVGLWWAEFPADRALREQTVLDDLTRDLPVRPPPAIHRYLFNHVRQHLLPNIALVLLILLFRDLIVLAVGGRLEPGHMDLVMIPAAIGVYLVAPEILRRIFNATPLEHSALRQRLEDVCRRSGLRCRDILLWQTDHDIANACVIGILPRWRYVLLSDRLIETMSDEQIEAVFAHELGHIVHHHMAWFVVFMAILIMGAISADNWIATQIPARFQTDAWETASHVAGAGGMFALMLVLFGMLSRRFERQADVFAARMMQTDWGTNARVLQGVPAAATLTAEATMLLAGTPDDLQDLEPDGVSHVGQHGARIFNSALRRVAIVNNIPLKAKDWFHPSIASRMQYLDEMSADPAKTRRFDRYMSHLYTTLLLALIVSGSALVYAAWTG